MAMEKTGMSSANLTGESHDEDPAVSMIDVLREEEELEADANAVLGDSDATNCTYLMGYVPRQALYSCITCNTSDPSAVCLACSYECHEGHDLIELYTKRNFKCDCGNGKFKDLSCKLFQKKAGHNEDNRYNHNFTGLYCICNRPYPDHDDDVEDEMIQCILCEDWYHGRHLGLDEVPEISSDTEMVCQGCMSKQDFLWAYDVQCSEVQKISSAETSNKNVDVVSNRAETNTPDKRKNNGSTSKQGKKSDKKQETSEEQGETCLLKELRKREVTHKDTAAFFSNGWRRKLCTCTDCVNMYSERNLEFLTDESDTVAAYELRGKQKTTPSSQYDKGLQALSNMNRLQQVEVLHGYNDLKSELNEYLKKFAENKKVVREEDIREFFSTMEARKKQKTSSSDGMSYFCK